MTQRLLIASGNAHKIKEISAILAGLPIEICSTKDLPQGVEEPVENGDSFLANAQIKAEGYAAHFDGWVLADDSGIVVPALNNEPGIFSARYAGPQATDADNRYKLMANIKELGGKADAYFVCSLCFLRPDLGVENFEEHWHGHVTDTCEGENGFGYDPMFIPKGDERTAAQWTENEKNTHSHRGQALRSFKAFLEELT
jgi:XTP/dITP diphosphohydrolase